MREWRPFNVEKWERKEHYEFFSGFDDPTFGVCAEVECTNTYQFAKKNKEPLFLAYLYLSLKAANEIKEFRLRFVDDKVVECDKIHAGPTIFRDDHSFSFSFIPYDSDFSEFKKNAGAVIEDAKRSKGLNLGDPVVNIIHYTTLPWVRFTSIKHPMSGKGNPSIPKISFGKIYNKNEKWFFPVDIVGHHGLMDGFHLSRYFQTFQDLLARFF